MPFWPTRPQLATGAPADGPVANSLTNDTLTDWGGGVAFWDTRVAIAAV